MKNRLCYLANAANPHTIRWANYFCEHGYEVHVISFEPPGELASNVIVHQLQCNLPFNLKYYAVVPEVTNLLNRIGRCILHAHYASGYGTLGRKLKIYPYVISVWGSDVFEFPQKSFFHRSVLKRNLAAADYICSTSRIMAVETSKYTEKNLHLTPFGIDCNVFVPSLETQHGSFVIGAVRSMEEAYGIDILLRAFKVFTNKYRQISTKLIFVGSGSRDRSYRQLARDLGLNASVQFIGVVPHSQVVNHMQSFSVFAALSRAESFGVALLEASACGIPVIASNVGGIPEVVVDGKTGILVPPNDVESAAMGIEKLFLQPELRRRLGQQGREWILQRYNWTQTARSLEILYEEITLGMLKKKCMDREMFDENQMSATGSMA